MAEDIKTTETQTEVTETKTPEEQETYTKDEVLKLIQSESDKRVTQALKTQKEKFDKEKTLIGLDAEQREKIETQDRIKDLESQLKEMNEMRTKQEVMTVLSNRGLNPMFANLIAIGEDVDEAINKIDELEKAFKDSVQEEVKKRLAQGGGSVKDTGVKSGEITQEEFLKMSLQQQAELYNENPELFKRLSK